MKSDKEINELFIKEYLKDFAPRRAAEAVGLNPECGYKLLEEPEVSAAIEKAMPKIHEIPYGLVNEMLDNHRIARLQGNITASNTALNMVGKHLALDKQVDGDYKTPIQPIEYIHANNIGFCEGNVIKYVSRWRNKNGLADLEKAKHYIELLIQLEKSDSGEVTTMKQCIIDATPEGAEYITRGGTLCFYRNITSKGYEYTYSKMIEWRSNRGRPKHKFFPIIKVTK